MKLERKNIIVELRTEIDDEGDKERSIIKQIGKYAKKDKLEVISFTEDIEDFGKVNNLITIQSNKVNIKRSGTITMNQQFIEGKRTECFYRHPYGSFLLEMETRSITHKPLVNGEKGSVMMEYKATVNEGQRRHHKLELTYMEEEKV